MYSQPAPSSVRADYSRPASQPAAAEPPKMTARIVVATLDGSVHQGPPPPLGYITWGQRLARNVLLGTILGGAIAYCVGDATPLLLAVGGGAAISALDKRP